MTLIRWRKSSYSGNQGDCVEVAHTLDIVRDSKNPHGTILPVTGFAAFVRDVKSGRFDR